MSKLLIPTLFALCVGVAHAQSGTVVTTDEKGKVESVSQTNAEKAADAFCLKQTGSHLKTITDKRGSGIECVNAPGHVWTRDDLDRTGALTTADALRQLDPSIRIHH